MYADALSFHDQAVFVMGAGSGGMGGETCRAMAQLGATVVAVDTTQARVDQICDEVRDAGATAVGIAGDARDPAFVKQAVSTAVAEVGRLDMLVNVVGGTRRETYRPFESMPDDMLDDVHDLNLRTAYYVCREVGAHMIGAGAAGRIVNFASVSGLAAAPFHAPYGAAKAGVMSLSRSLASEWGRFGIRSNCVAPGLIETRREIPSSPPEIDDTWYPLGTAATMQDVVGAVVFLLSPLSAGMTGQVLDVDAGASTRNPLGGPEWWGRNVAGDFDVRMERQP